MTAEDAELLTEDLPETADPEWDRLWDQGRRPAGRAPPAGSSLTEGEEKPGDVASRPTMGDAGAGLHPETPLAPTRRRTVTRRWLDSRGCRSPADRWRSCARR